MSDLSNLMRHSYLFPLGCPSWKRTKRLSPLHPILKGPQEYNQEPVRADGGMPVPLHEWVWSWPWSEPFIQDKKEGEQTQLWEECKALKTAVYPQPTTLEWHKPLNPKEAS